MFILKNGVSAWNSWSCRRFLAKCCENFRVVGRFSTEYYGLLCGRRDNLCLTMKHIVAVLLAASVLSTGAFAKGGGGHSSRGMSGTGSKSASHSVHGYTKKDGTYIAPHHS